MGIKGTTGEGSKESENVEKTGIILHLNRHVQNVGRHVNVTGISAKGWEAREELVIENWREGDSCYEIKESLAELCSAVKWKAELISDELGHVTQEISKMNFEGAAWFLLLPMGECERKEVNRMKNF